MAFWENMRIWQMGRLLQKRERPDVKEFWTDWQYSIRHAGGISGVTDSQLSGYPKAPAAYFLTFVAILCEMERQSPRLGMEEIDAAYLSDIFDGRRDWKDTVILILLDDSAPAGEKMHLFWTRMLHYAADFLNTGISTNITLDRLLARIREANEQANEANLERLLNPESIENLSRVMEIYDERWQQLCESCAAPNPTVETLCSFIQNGIRQIILTGAPGTGKTYAAAEAARHLACGSRIQMAQFHPLL